MSEPVCIGVLIPPWTAPPEPPEARPFGRAALQLAAEGIELVFGHEVDRAGRITGVAAAPGAWRRRSTAAAAFYNRITISRWAPLWARLEPIVAAYPLANPESFRRLCRDKVAFQRHAEAVGVPMPPIEVEPARFDAARAAWGPVFSKPRFGIKGRGIHRVGVEDTWPALDTIRFVQRAITPPPGWAGVSVRVLVQRAGPGEARPVGRWSTVSEVVRRSAHDPVANVDRGAEAVPAEDAIDPDVRAAVAAQVDAVCHLFDGLPEADTIVEAGVDVVLDDAGRAHLIEVNSRPRGRVEALARRWPERFAAAHLAASTRPFRYLAAAFGGR